MKFREKLLRTRNLKSFLKELGYDLEYYYFTGYIVVRNENVAKLKEAIRNYFKKEV